MKHLDALFDELQEPIAQLMDWCDADKDRAVLACFEDLYGTSDENYGQVLFDAFCEAYPEHPLEDMHNKIEDCAEEIYSAYEDGKKPDIDYVALYQPLEHIINDRIEVYNKS